MWRMSYVEEENIIEQTKNNEDPAAEPVEVPGEGEGGQGCRH
jgi:hypothetical protein